MATAFQPVPGARPRASADVLDRNDLAIYFAVVLGYLMLLPPQLNVEIETSSIPPYRFFLMPAALYVLQGALRGGLRFVWADALIAVATAWIALALFMTTEFGEAATGAIAQTIDILFGYLLARASIRTTRDLRVFLVLIAPGLIATGAIMAAEALSKRFLVHTFFAELTGARNYLRPDYRFGLLRASGPFPHPILGGLFLASFLPLYFLSGIRGWPRILGSAAALCSFFTLSSAAFLSLVMSGALLFYNYLVAAIQNVTWRLFLGGAAIFTFFAEVGTESGTFNLLIRYASLNASSAANRRLIWQYGSESVKKNPVFGIGYADWERPSWMLGSIDHYWLILAMRFGVLPSLLVLIAVIITVVSLSKASLYGPEHDRKLRRGLAISLAIFALGVVSVTVWLSVQVWFYIMIGAAVSLTLAAQQERAVALHRARAMGYPMMSQAR